MCRESLHFDAGLPPCRFVFGNVATDGVSRKWVEADMRHARLSLTFRAYYQLRSLLPLKVRQLLQRHHRITASARWCYADEFVDELTQAVAALDDGVTVIHPWPDDAQFAFVLTHDVETSEGVRRVAAIADLEEKLGFRSSWNFVPHKYPIDHGLLRDLTDRGFELGVHGYNHDGQLFSSRSIFDRRVPAINVALDAWGAVGFRAPMVHRNLNWLQSLNIQYDASCFDVDPYQPMPGGVGSLWPFIVGRFVELPYTLPQDHTLFITLNLSDGQIWHDKLDCIAQQHGMALVITHPDYLDAGPRLDAYRHLLCRAQQIDGLWRALPREVASWWRDRDASTLRHESGSSWFIAGPAAGRARTATVRVAQVGRNGQPGRTLHNDASGHPSNLALVWSQPPVVTHRECEVLR